MRLHLRGSLSCAPFASLFPPSDINRSREFYERTLGMEADDTVPSRLYFHCDGFIVALAAGATITSPIEKRPWGEQSFYCTDPDGHQLCFVDDSTLFLGHGADWA